MRDPTLEPVQYDLGPESAAGFPDRPVDHPGGGEYLVEPGLPRDAQVIRIRVTPPRGARVVEVRADDSTVLQLEAPFAGRLPTRPGRHRVQLWLPGGTDPLATAEFVVRGGGE